MEEYESLSHTTWDCKYSAAFIPKCRREAPYQKCAGFWAKFSASSRFRSNQRLIKGIDARSRAHAAFDPAGIRGVTGLYPLFRHFDKTLTAWAMRKFKRLRRHKTRQASSSNA